MNIVPLYDPRTFTLTYIMYKNNNAIMINPMLDYNPLSSTTSTESLQKITTFLKKNGLKLQPEHITYPHNLKNNNTIHLIKQTYLQKGHPKNISIPINCPDNLLELKTT
jgi:hypothetical protein